MADKKITDLSQATDADSTDILMIVDGPGESSPQNKKITIQNLPEIVPAMTVSQMNAKTNMVDGQLAWITDNNGGPTLACYNADVANGEANPTWVVITTGTAAPTT